MVDKLKAGNTTGAVNLFTPLAQAKYASIFTALWPTLASAVSQLGDIATVTASENIAEIVIVQDVAGVKQSFSIYLVRGEDGQWQIENM